MDRPEDQKRTLPDIISWLANFTEKIKWVFTKDLKPRALFGFKSDGTIVFINDADGYPQFTPRFTNYVPEIVMPKEVFGWIGTPGDVDGTPWISKGYRAIIFLCTQTWTTDPTSIKIQQHMYDEAGTLFVDESNICDQSFTVIANLRSSFIILQALNTNESFPVGEMAYRQRIRITTVGAGTAGAIDVTGYGIK